MSLKYNLTASNNDYSNDLKAIHEKGVVIAKKHITPFLNDLEKTHNYKKTEICAALILLGYSAVFSVVNDRMKALCIYRDLSRISLSVLGKNPHKKTYH